MLINSNILLTQQLGSAKSGCSNPPNDFVVGRNFMFGIASFRIALLMLFIVDVLNALFTPHPYASIKTILLLSGLSELVVSSASSIFLIKLIALPILLLSKELSSSEFILTLSIY